MRSCLHRGYGHGGFVPVGVEVCRHCSGNVRWDEMKWSGVRWDRVGWLGRGKLRLRGCGAMCVGVWGWRGGSCHEMERGSIGWGGVGLGRMVCNGMGWDGTESFNGKRACD